MNAPLSLVLLALLGAGARAEERTPATRPGATSLNAARAQPVARSADMPAALSATLLLDAGYDSNVLLLPDTSSGAGATRDGSPSAALEGRVDWRAWQDRRGFVKLGGLARQDRYHETLIDSNSHYGGNLIASYMNAERTLIPALALSGNRYLLDGDAVADDAFGRLSLARRGLSHVDVLSIDAHRILYAPDALDERSGILWAGQLRHWFLVEDHQPSRRLELGLRVGRYVAHEDWQTYLTLRPDLSFTWRWGEGSDAGNWRLTAESGVDWRQYQVVAPGETEREQLLQWDNQAQLAYGLAAASSLGPYVGFTRRLDNLDGRTYNRWLAGIRLLVTIP